MQPDAQAVLEFWFGAPQLPEYGAKRDAWFRKDPAFDALIARSFGPTIETALAGGLEAWDESARGTLARIVVLDQFTRNAFRDTPRAFAGDVFALAAARRLVAEGGDQALSPLERSFVYLPFEHAEDLAAQDEGMQLFTVLARQHPDMQESVRWSVLHRDVIARFGRFPHRNEVLGRISTAEEIAFLEQPGSRF
jgi:uncharacterized protein (DUF924 family)